MCGISGWFDIKNDLTDKCHIVESMSVKLAARGPDSSGIMISPHAVLAHRRLAVMDPAGGSQPMTRERDDRRCTIAYNGELYNAPELRKVLEGHGYRFETDCDTEVLLLAYMQWGTECVKLFNGIFAFAIWDEKERRAFLARDHFGVKPLFYTELSGGLLFASEIKALLAHPMIKAEIGIEGLSEILALSPAKTPGVGVFKSISELKPAHCMIYGGHGLKIERYWRLACKKHTDSFDDTVEKVGALVTDAIKRQFASDVPLCAFLSGGLDSSAITALAANHFGKCGKGILHTYSIDYKDNERYFSPSLYQPDSDGPWIARISAEFGTKHTNVTVNSDEVAAALDKAVEARDLPGMADIDSSLWLFCREVKKSATVALSGECADEVFGGYPWFHVPEILNSDSFPWFRSTGERFSVLSEEMLHITKPSKYIERRYRETLSKVPHLEGENRLERKRREMFYLNFSWFMQTLLDRKDRMSMAHGLEVRVPYCDYRLVEYVWNIPWDIKMLGGREKGLLRKALEGVLPQDVLYRKKSPYPKIHNPAYERIVKERLRDIIYDVSSPLPAIINKKEVEKMMTEESNLGKPWYGQLMTRPQLYAWLVQVDAWLRMYKVSIRI